MPWMHLLTSTGVAQIVAVAALILAVLALVRSRQGQKSSGDPDSKRLLERVAAEEQNLRRREEIEALKREIATLEARQRGYLQRVALVRFSAFPDSGSDQSFSLALLDARGDGLVLTSLAGRHETRVYAKPVRDGKSQYRLAPEEEQALNEAQSGEVCRV